MYYITHINRPEEQMITILTFAAMNTGTPPQILKGAFAHYGILRGCIISRSNATIRTKKIERESHRTPTLKLPITIELQASSFEPQASANQHISTSAHQQINTSANQQISTSANQQISKSTHQQISTSAHQHISTSANQHISTSAHQHISTSAHLPTSI